MSTLDSARSARYAKRTVKTLVTTISNEVAKPSTAVNVNEACISMEELIAKYGTFKSNVQKGRTLVFG